MIGCDDAWVDGFILGTGAGLLCGMMFGFIGIYWRLMRDSEGD